jgi:hypothetical protein
MKKLISAISFLSVGLLALPALCYQVQIDSFIIKSNSSMHDCSSHSQNYNQERTLDNVMAENGGNQGNGDNNGFGPGNGTGEGDTPGDGTGFGAEAEAGDGNMGSGENPGEGSGDGDGDCPGDGVTP